MMMSESSSATRWGIISCGKISHDFVTAIQSCLSSNEHKVVAVAARNLEGARDFAQRHNIPKAYDSYEELANDSEIQVIYSSINPTHLKVIKTVIMCGKHVLCEKPLCMNVKEVQEVINYAREKNVFLMEGIWSRFFPVYQRIQEELQNSSIGQVVQVIVSLCTLIGQKERCVLKNLGGGTVLDIGVYGVQFASFVFGGEKPFKVIAGGHLNEEGIDESTSSTLLYSKGRTATIVTHGRAKYESDAVIVGTQGVIKVPYRFWCPTELITPEGKEIYPLPETATKFNYANSVGLMYEVNEVRQCILQGLNESPKMPLNESLSIAEVMESIRKQVGVVYDQDS